MNVRSFSGWYLAPRLRESELVTKPKIAKEETAMAMSANFDVIDLM